MSFPVEYDAIQIKWLHGSIDNNYVICQFHLKDESLPTGIFYISLLSNPCLESMVFWELIKIYILTAIISIIRAHILK